jgi:phage/plasmid-associated DNA primase
MVVPFEEQIPTTEEDSSFELRLMDPNGPGPGAILAWMVEGYRAYLADPDSIQEIPIGAVDANLRFWADVSDLDRCLSDVCEFGEPKDYFVQPSQLYSVYLAWCEEHGIKEKDRLNLITLGRQLEGKGHRKTSTKRCPGHEGKAWPVRVGLRLKSGWIKAVSGA